MTNNFVDYVKEMVPDYKKYDLNELVRCAQVYENSRMNHSFSELLADFADGLSLSEIGKKLDLSRERVRQIYNQYFSTLFPQFNSGWERTRAAKEFKSLSCVENLDEMRTWTEQLDKHGIKYEYIKNGVRYMQNALLVNKKPCKIYPESTEYRSGSRLYTRLNVYASVLNDYKFLLTCRTINNRVEYLIIPTDKIDIKEGAQKKSIYIPFVETTNRNDSEFLDFRNNFKLLQSK